VTNSLAMIEWQILGAAAPWVMVFLFLQASAFMIWRLECLSQKGFEGTVLGTLIMPYCSGIGNLVFAWVMGRQAAASSEVLTNSLVNNVTNLTLLIGLPTVIWGAPLFGKKKKQAKAVVRTEKINRLSLLLTLTAGLFFTGAVWALAKDGNLNLGDGIVLAGIFVFWQCFHVFEVMKSNVRQNRSMPWSVYPELIALALGAVVTFYAIDGLVVWMNHAELGWIRRDHIGWLSAWLMVLPNALLALYYGWRGQPETVYASQVGDGHICIPLCIGIYAMLAGSASSVPSIFGLSILVLVGALTLHLVLIAIFGKLPRMVGWLFLAAYGVYLWQGLPR
jgi:cation:H+ antiporter